MRILSLRSLGHRRGALFLSLVFVGAGAAAGPAAPASDAAMTCAILGRTSDRGMLLLEAVLEAGTDAVVGRYQFSIRTVGQGGQSSSVQSGQVHLMAGERKALGSITVAAVDMDVDAQLIVRSGGGGECIARY